MLLTGGMFRLLKQSISLAELQGVHMYMKLFNAQAPVLQASSSRPLMFSCCCTFQRLLETLVLYGPTFASHLRTPMVIYGICSMALRMWMERLLKESIDEKAHVLCSLERVWSGSVLLSEKQLKTLPKSRRKRGFSVAVLWMEFCATARVTSVLWHGTISLSISKNWRTVKIIVQYTSMSRSKKNVLKQHVMSENIAAVWPANILPSLKCWRDTMSNCPNTEREQ